MNLMRSTCRKRATEFLKTRLPLMTIATLLATSSAVVSFCLTVEGRASTPQKRVVARGRLMGTREVQQVVIWNTRSNSASATGTAAHLAIEDLPGGRRIWQADESFQALNINSIQVVDLNGDSIPEILSLWSRGGSRDAVLRVFHWNRGSRSFAEMVFKPADQSSPVQTYRVLGKRIVIHRRGTTAGLEFEARGAEIVPFRRGGGVTTQTECGIEGEAVISPSHPGPIREGQSDTSPFKTTLVILKASDRSEVSRLETGADGRFRVALPPGVYLVGPPAGTGRRLPRGAQETVTVVPGRFAHVTINFDSGMR
jgi:hypothetical protein